jgi:hypothetical protein
MSNRKFFRIIQGSLSKIGKSFRAIPQSFVNWLLRIALTVTRRTRSAGGFILPTTVLLVLVVALTVGALTYRAFTRNTSVIADSQQRVIYNAATPTIDRARSKLEYLFDPSKDTRYPGGVPSESRLLSMLLNDGSNSVSPLLVSGADPYTLPDEKRVDLKGDNSTDNAWSYRTDTNGDGTADATVIYSVIFRAPPVSGASNTQQQLITLSDRSKADSQLVRQGPLSQEDSTIRCASNSGRITTEDGWFQEPSNSSVLRKNFQVDAYVLPDAPNAIATTLEFTQDRQLDRGNKWGAWFRNDLEIFPGPNFNWNGAIHTEGSLILGKPGSGTTQLYLISSVNSCLFYQAASEISVTQRSGPDFLGHVYIGQVGADSSAGSAAIDVQTGAKTYKTVTIDPSLASTGKLKPSQVLADATTILVNDGYQSIDTADRANKLLTKWTNKGKLPTADFDTRITAVSQVAPYVDDLYRADDRWGPKPRYQPSSPTATQYAGNFIKAPDRIGDPIATSPNLDVNQVAALIASTPATGKADAAVGLDGYWERRARNEGLRILVGQRLELGNLNTWVTPRDINSDGYITAPISTGAPGTIAVADEREGDPLYPPTLKPFPINSATDRVQHLDLQRRTLRDNLAAVQSMAVYHKAASTGKDFPVACLASTSHPGTLTTLKQSINFFPTTFPPATPATMTTSGGNSSLLTDFFTGRGTNGWEFEPPAINDADFATKVATGQPLRIALTNLANFAGDPEGTYPLDLGTDSASKTNTSQIRPYPALTMWGNHSNLRRTLKQLDDGVAYNNLSPADKTYLHTAACTLGMLAYEIDTIQKFDPSNPANEDVASGVPNVMTSLAADIANLMDGSVTNGEVLPKAQLGTYQYDPTKPDTPLPGTYNPRDYDNVPPEVYIGKLREQFAAVGGISTALNNAKLRMAELIMLSNQIRRDRTYGFRASPAWGEYTANSPSTSGPPSVAYATACDPEQFALKASAAPIILRKRKLALSRLCGAISTENYVPGTSFSTPADPTTYAPTGFTQVGVPPTTLATMPTVLPKFPALYYLFPQIEHNVVGKLENPDTTPFVADQPTEYDHRQPGNADFPAPTATLALNFAVPTTKVPPEVAGKDITPGTPIRYIKLADVETYVKEVDNLGSAASPFKVVSPIVAKLRRTTGYTAPTPGVYPNLYRALLDNVNDTSVRAIALSPRATIADWKLPTGTLADNKTSATVSGGPNIAPNYIMIATGPNPADTEPRSVPFLERAFMDGRQLMTIRTTDIDLGMLRSSNKGLTNDAWLPTGGIVYAFREDAVREDAILRPGGAGTNLTDPANPTDPTLTVDATNRGITLKPIDFLPDPDRRPYGFRLRNGSQLKRNDSLGLAPKENIRGLSFFSDQPVYIQGDFNLHQNGGDDSPGSRLEEFKEQLNGTYSTAQFYTRSTGEPAFANADPSITDNAKKDRWRPSEILSDAISILSDNFCDGAIADAFVVANPTSRPDFGPLTSVNNQVNRTGYGGAVASVGSSFGLFGPGCTGNGFTSFHNHTRPQNPLNNNEEWVKEVGNNVTLPQRNATYSNSYWGDFTAPIKLDRTGDPLVATAQTPPGTPPSSQLPLQRPRPYDLSATRASYCPPGGNANSCRYLMTPTATRVNSIIVSGITPSRLNQSYGGLHNFPRFLEDWGNGDTNLFINGSFLQLSFNNYATGPFEQEALEPGQATSSSQNIPQYQPPARLWGYDVGLQFSPAGPAASRFVTASSTRNEFYNEPPVSDPYVNNLCVGLRDQGLKLFSDVPADTKAKVSCPQ